MNLVGTVVCVLQKVKAKLFTGALLLNVALLVFDQVSQNMEKMLGPGLRGASLALLDPSGFSSDLIQSGTPHFEIVSSVGVITLSIYIIIYFILITNLWGTHFCDLQMNRLRHSKS